MTAKSQRDRAPASRLECTRRSLLLLLGGMSAPILAISDSGKSTDPAERGAKAPLLGPGLFIGTELNHRREDKPLLSVSMDADYSTRILRRLRFLVGPPCLHEVATVAEVKRRIESLRVWPGALVLVLVALHGRFDPRPPQRTLLSLRDGDIPLAELLELVERVCLRGSAFGLTILKACHLSCDENSGVNRLTVSKALLASEMDQAIDEEPPFLQIVLDYLARQLGRKAGSTWAINDFLSNVVDLGGMKRLGFRPQFGPRKPLTVSIPSATACWLPIEDSNPVIRFRLGGQEAPADDPRYYLLL